MEESIAEEEEEKTQRFLGGLAIRDNQILEMPSYCLQCLHNTNDPFL